MTLAYVARLVRRWIWLLVLGALVAAVASYVVTARLPVVYEARAQLLVDPTPSGGAVSSGDVQAAQALATTYVELAKTRAVLDAAAQQSGFSLTYDQIAGLVQVSPVRNTQLLQVTGHASDPAAAAKLANAAANALVDYVRTNQSDRAVAARTSLQAQIDQISSQIADDNRRLDALKAQPASGDRDNQINSLQMQVAQLQQSQAAALKAQVDVGVAQAQVASSLRLVDTAVPPSGPIQPRTLMNVLVGALVGAFLALVVAYVVELMERQAARPLKHPAPSIAGVRAVHRNSEKVARDNAEVAAG